MYIDTFLNNQRRGGIQTFDHWIYGYWNKKINTEGLDDLITYDFLKSQHA